MKKNELLGASGLCRSLHIIWDCSKLMGDIWCPGETIEKIFILLISLYVDNLFLDIPRQEILATLGVRTLHNSTHWSMIIFANSSPPIGQFGAIKTSDWVVECKYELRFKIMVTISQDNPLVPANTAHPSQYCQQSTQVFSQRSQRLCSQRCLSRHSIWLPVNV